MPDFNSYPGNVVNILARHQYKISLDTTITNITKNFADLSDKQRSCKLNRNRVDPFYIDVNCRMDKCLDLAEKFCECTPWYVLDSKTTGDICGPEGLKCFSDQMENLTDHSWIESCPPECISSKLNIESEAVDLTWLSKIEKASLKATFGGFENFSYFNTLEAYGDSKFALIHVNFINPQVTVITKDAKVTFADQLGSIGGTLGMFIGLSFVGILDFLIRLWSFMRKIICPSKKKVMF